MMFIYKITNISNKMSYIGQTKNLKKRWIIHRSQLRGNYHPNNLLQDSWNTYGEASFVFEVLDKCAFETSSDNLERFWIKFHKSTDRTHGFNKDNGGRVGKITSPETRKRLSIINKKNPTRPMLGKNHSEEAKNKMRKQKHSNEQRKLMSQVASLRTGENNPFHGRRHTEEFKKKMSALRSKPVLCIETGIVYASTIEASVQMKISRSFIAQCCAGRHEKAKGFRFSYNVGASNE